MSVKGRSGYKSQLGRSPSAALRQEDRLPAASANQAEDLTSTLVSLHVGKNSMTEKSLSCQSLPVLQLSVFTAAIETAVKFEQKKTFPIKDETQMIEYM